jgi:hypothetical protein
MYGDVRNVYTFLENCSGSDLGLDWMILKCIIRVLVCMSVGWVNLTQGMLQGLSFMDMKNLKVPQKKGRVFLDHVNNFQLFKKSVRWS